MNLDNVWTWEKRNLACRIQTEDGNPFRDNLLKMYQDLTGKEFNYQAIIDESCKKKKNFSTSSKLSTTQLHDDNDQNVSKERLKIIGAAEHALTEMHLNDTKKLNTKSSQNIKKAFTVLPSSPPPRIILAMQRERSKLSNFPEQQNHKSISQFLEKKILKDSNNNRNIPSTSTSYREEELFNKPSEKSIEEIFKKISLIKKNKSNTIYNGDLFNSQGEYNEGMVFLSRMKTPTNKLSNNKSLNNQSEKKKLDSNESSNNINLNNLSSSSNNNNNSDNENYHSDFNESSSSSNNNKEKDTAPDLTAKLNCVISLCNWSRNPANAHRLASEGAVRAILQLSMEPSAKILRYCIAAFRFMSEHQPLAISMIEEGAISTISDLINSRNDEFSLYNLAIALVNLTRINGKEGQLVEAAIVLALMNIIMLNPDLGSTCVRGLYNLTCVDLSYPSIERVIRALVTLSLSGTSTVKHLCAAALCNLSDLKSVRGRMVEEGAINVLSVLSRGAETRTRRICAVILQNLSAAKSVRVEMASRNSVAAAYGLSSDQDPVILRCIGLTLSRLAMESLNCQRIINEGGITALCNIAIKYPTIPGITQPVAFAFQLLSSNTSYRKAIAAEGSITAIASLLRSSIDLYTLQHSLLALCNLLNEKENHSSIIQQGLILTLISMCDNENNLIKDFCSLAFLNLSYLEESRKQLVNAGSVAAIISIINKENKLTRQRCAATLCNLTYYIEGMPRMVSDGIIPCIVSLILIKEEIETVHYACASLCRLSCTVENAKLILESGAIPNVVQGAIDGDFKTKQFCGAVLYSLSFYNECRLSLCEYGAIAALKSLSNLNDEITKQRCLISFANLSYEVSIQSYIIKEGVVSIISELANSYQEINYRCCAKAICNLACNTESKEIVAKEGGVLALMMISMVQSVLPLTKMLCVIGLNNLLDDNTVNYMLQEGLVSSLANLSKIEKDTDDTFIIKDNQRDILNLCIKIFNRLTLYKEGRKKLIERKSTLKILLTLCNTNNKEINLIAIHTCCNLILDTTIVSDIILESNGISALDIGLDNEEDEVISHVLEAIFSLSSSSNYVEIIAKSKIPKKLLTLLKNINKNEENNSEEIKLVKENQLNLITKIICLLTYHNNSRVYLQNKDYIKEYFKIISVNKLKNQSYFIISSLYYLVLKHKSVSDLLSSKILNTILIIYSYYSNENDEEDKNIRDEKVEIFIIIINILRLLSESSSSLIEISNNNILKFFLHSTNLLKKSLDEINSTSNSSLPQTARGVTNYNTNNTLEGKINRALYNITAIINLCAQSDNNIRLNIASNDTCTIFETLSSVSSCIDSIIISIGLFLMDQKARNAFINERIAIILKNYALLAISTASNSNSNVLQDSSLSNLILAIYSMTKVVSCREILMKRSIEMDQILLKFLKHDNARIRANSNRAYKNLNSDLNEAIEEGAVSNLIAMSLEGKLKNHASDEFQYPTLHLQSSVTLTLPDHFSTAEINNFIENATRWYSTVTTTKVEPTKEGPEPPAPPVISTEGSLQYPSMMEELDSGEVEGKTKMSFAKMQIPSNIKDLNMLKDEDFHFGDDEEEVTEENDKKEENEDKKSDKDETYNDDFNTFDEKNYRENSDSNVEESHSYNENHSQSSPRFDESLPTPSRIGSSSSINSKSSQKSKHNNHDSLSHSPLEDRRIKLKPVSSEGLKRKKSSKSNVIKDSSHANMSEQASRLGLYA